MNLGSVQVHRPRIPQSFVAIAQPARICLKHLRTVSADDATTLWRVNSTSAISLISPSALTVGSPFQLGQRRRRLTDATMPRCHNAIWRYDHMAMGCPRGTDRSHRRGGNFRFSPPDRAQPGLRSAPWGGHPPLPTGAGALAPNSRTAAPGTRPGGLVFAANSPLAPPTPPGGRSDAHRRRSRARARIAPRRAATISRGAKNLTPRCAPMLK